MTISERFKEIRKDAGLTQEAFGREIGVTRAVIANIEGERVEVKDIQVLTVCRRFGINKDWLLTGEGDMHAPLSRNQEIAKLASELYNDADPLRKQLFDLISGMGEDELKAAKILKDYIEKNYEK